MAYLPKSKLKIQTTPGGELVYKISRKPYSGTYIETSTNKYYAGGNPQDLSTELTFFEEATTVEFGSHPDVTKYKKLNKLPFNTLSKTLPIISTRNIPEEEDYNRGYYPRFFAKKHNSNDDYFEIDAETFVKLKNKNPQHDYRLYHIGQIEWALSGNTEKINSANLKRLEKNFPFLNVLFSVLNEFQKSTEKVITNTQTPSFSYQYGGQNQNISGGGSSGGGGGGY